MSEGKLNGYVCQGFNPLASFPHKDKLVEGLSKLKFLVTIDPLVTETSKFWQNHGELNDVDPARIQTEVFRLPSSCFAEEDGSLVNSGAGCSGTGARRSRPARRRTTPRSWRSCSRGCARSTRRRAARSPSPS